MVHFPTVPPEMGDPKAVLEETWRELEKLYDSGKIRALGVSNFSCQDLDDLLESCSIRPHIIQSEFHPCQNPVDLRELCDEVNITFCVSNLLILSVRNCVKFLGILSACKESYPSSGSHNENCESARKNTRSSLYSMVDSEWSLCNSKKSKTCENSGKFNGKLPNSFNFC